MSWSDFTQWKSSLFDGFYVFSIFVLTEHILAFIENLLNVPFFRVTELHVK